MTEPEIYAILKEALHYLLASRMEHFSRTDRIYQEHRERPQSIPLGFEIMVTAELYQVLKQRLGDCVYLDFPVGKRGRIDLAIQQPTELILVENKMYYSDANAYGKDFDKLKMIVDDHHSVLAVLIHFHFYDNRKRPVQALFEKLFNNELSSTKYWRSLDYIGDSSKRHFYVLGFRQLDGENLVRKGSNLRNSIEEDNDK